MHRTERLWALAYAGDGGRSSTIRHTGATRYSCAAAWCQPVAPNATVSERNARC
jgi:hypothetical protein